MSKITQSQDMFKAELVQVYDQQNNFVGYIKQVEQDWQIEYTNITGTKQFCMQHLTKRKHLEKPLEPVTIRTSRAKPNFTILIQQILYKNRKVLSQITQQCVYLW